MSLDNALGEYLRARREALQPPDVGITDPPSRRRVAGLRREEVARLAGISPEYYVRLEQGRERHPSEQVLSAIARGLRLSASAEEYMQRLVRPLPERGYDATRVEAAHDRLAAFIAAIPLPAFVHDRVLDVLVSNRAARALSPTFRTGVNLVEEAFLGEDLRALYVDWDEMSARLVSYLLAQARTPPPDARLPALVEDLSRRSPRFAELWAHGDVGGRSSGVNRLRHPTVGDIEVNYERLCFAGTDYPVVIVYHAAPGTTSEAALSRLMSDAG